MERHRRRTPFESFIAPQSGRWARTPSTTEGLCLVVGTNGTAAGTQELTGIVGAASTGATPTDFTVFNGKALFNGANAAGHLGLWVTNGTAAGTQELTSIAGAATTGLDPTDMTVFNNEVLFNVLTSAPCPVCG